MKTVTLNKRTISAKEAKALEAIYGEIKLLVFKPTTIVIMF